MDSFIEVALKNMIPTAEPRQCCEGDTAMFPFVSLKDIVSIQKDNPEEVSFLSDFNLVSTWPIVEILERMCDSNWNKRQLQVTEGRGGGVRRKVWQTSHIHANLLHLIYILCAFNEDPNTCICLSQLAFCRYLSWTPENWVWNKSTNIRKTVCHTKLISFSYATGMSLYFTRFVYLTCFCLPRHRSDSN